MRQSRLGVRSSTPTALGDLKTTFEFELFGTGVDEGQTTFRLRHAYGELGRVRRRPVPGARSWTPTCSRTRSSTGDRRAWSFFRNVQVRWMPIQGDSSSLTLALERPGASGDQGVYSDRIELQNIKARFPLPDFSGAYKYAADWGYVARRRHAPADQVGRRARRRSSTCRGDATGWGLNLSSNLKPGKNDVIRLQFVFGEGIQNYMNDSPVDIGIVNNFSQPGDADPRQADPDRRPTVVVPRSHVEREVHAARSATRARTTTTPTARRPTPSRSGQYALGNLLYYPVPNVMMGGELQWGRRENFSDGFQSDGVKVQFSFKYNFSWKLGG